MQQAYNEAHGITPETIRKSIRAGIEAEAAAHAVERGGRADRRESIYHRGVPGRTGKEMLAAADALEFERAAAIRDRIDQMQGQIGTRTDEARLEHGTRSERWHRHKTKQTGKRVPKPGKP